MQNQIDPNTISTRPISMLAVFRAAVCEAIIARDVIDDVFSSEWSAANEEVRFARSHLNAELTRLNTFDADADFDGDTVVEAPCYALDTTDVTARHVGRSAARRRQIRATRQGIAGLRDAIDEGWDVGPELAHEERRLASLEVAERRSAQVIGS